MFLKLLCLTLFLNFTFAGDEVSKWTRKTCHMDTEKMLKQGFSFDQLEAICEAAEFFDIDILIKDDKAVVLAGEKSHYRDDRAKELSDQLIQQFSFRAIENLTWDNKGALFHIYQFGGNLITKGSSVKDSIRKGYYFHSNGTTEALYYNFEEISEVARTQFGPSQNIHDWVSMAHDSEFIDQTQDITIHLERDQKVNDILNRNCPDGVATCSDFYLLDVRNSQMRHYITQAFNWFPDKDKILVFSGYAHIKGISRGLHCLNNFESHKVTRGASALNHEYPGYFESTSPPSCESWDF